MSYPTITVKHNRKGNAGKDGTALVEVVVCHERKRVYLSTGVRLALREWNNGKVVRRLDASECQRQIEQVSGLVRDIVAQLWGENRFSLQALKDEFSTQRTASSLAPHEWIVQRIGESHLRDTSKEHHYSLVRYLRKTHQFERWSDFTVANVEKFDSLVRDRVSKQSTVYNYHKRLRVWVRAAVRAGILERSPYDQFHCDKGEDLLAIRYLTMEEIERLRQAKLQGVLEKVRDLWLFGFYTGLGYAEIASLTREDCVTENGRTYLVKRRQKTGVPVKVLLMSEAVALLEKYGYNLPTMSNQKYNYFLKIAATAAEIEKNLTSHMARHSFATYALKMGVPRDVIAVMLGHRGLREVDRYARRLQEDVDEQYKKLEESLAEKEKP